MGPHMCGDLGGFVVVPSGAVDGVGRETERPVVAGVQPGQERVVVVGVPAAGGGPAGLLDQVGEVGFGRADYEEVGLGSAVAVDAPQHPWPVPWLLRDL